MKIDLFVDLNTEDETGLPWTYLGQAADPSLVVPGRLLVVGAGSAVAVAEVVDVAADGRADERGPAPVLFAAGPGRKSTSVDPRPRRR